MQVVPASLARLPMEVGPSGRKDPLPWPFVARVRILPPQSHGELHPTSALRTVPLVLIPDKFEMSCQGRLHCMRKHRDPVLVAFSLTNQYLVRCEIDVLYAKPAAF